jgi:hypothetical protein
MLTRSIQLIKLVFWIYIAGFAVVAFHAPRSVFEAAIEDKNPGVLLTPMFAPSILRAYAQFAASLTWPYSSQPNLIRLSDLLQTQGSDDPPWSRSLVFDEAPLLSEVTHDTIRITDESYQRTIPAGFPSWEMGLVLHIGNYFCLTDANPVERSRCFSIVRRSNDSYFWQELGETERQPAHISAS